MCVYVCVCVCVYVCDLFEEIGLCDDGDLVNPKSDKEADRLEIQERVTVCVQRQSPIPGVPKAQTVNQYWSLAC